MHNAYCIMHNAHFTIPIHNAQFTMRNAHRVSKSRRHTSAQRFLGFERKTVKITSFNLILLILTHIFCVLCSFRHTFMRKYFSDGHFVGATHIAFRKSEYTMPNVQFAIHNVQCTMQNAQCTMQNAQCTMLNAQFAIYNAQCTMHNAQCTMSNAQ